MYHTFEARMALAKRIYELDARVYQILGSGLGRVFNNQEESTCRNLAELMADPGKLHYLRSEIALIGNMARTIPDRQVRARIMKRYEAIVQEIDGLVGSFGEEDILDEDIFFRTVRASFAMRRKKLSNGLASGFSELGKQGAAEVIEAAGFDPNVRGETLSIPDFVKIANEIVKRRG